MKRSNKLITLTFMEIRKLYRINFETMPGNLTYYNALKRLLAEIGYVKVLDQLRELEG